MSWAVAPLLGALLLGALQVVPVGTGVHAALSPAGARLRADLVDPAAHEAIVAPGPQDAMPDETWRPLSLYPASTRRDLAMLVLATTAFVLGSFWFQTGSSQLWLCGLVGLNGAVFALFGIVQRLSYNGKLYWLTPLADGGQPFAAYVNRNNAGGYLILCLAAAVAMGVWATQRDGRVGRGLVLTAEGGRWLRRATWLQPAVRAVADLDALSIAALALASSIAAGVICTFSRAQPWRRRQPRWSRPACWSGVRGAA